MKNKIKIIYLIIIGFIIIFLLISHTFSLFNVIVDIPSILLLIILIIFPFIPDIRKIKWGDFEAEFNLVKTRKKLGAIKANTKLIQNYTDQMFLIAPESKKELTFSELKDQIDALLIQLAELQKELFGIEIHNEAERKETEKYKVQIDALLVQLAELQKQLIKLEKEK